jgi:hypothetical protein
MMLSLCVLTTRGQSNVANRFSPYSSCSLADGLSVVETAPLSPGITSRTVKTILGSEEVPLIAGQRVMFAYPGEDFYANVKVELLPEQGYNQAKKALITNFEYILASGDNSRNYALKPHMNGFEIQGLDRGKREGGVLGIYLLFDDPTRTVVTIYMLNQEPPRRFKTMEEYARLRDSFLTGYTACIRKNLKTQP